MVIRFLAGGHSNAPTGVYEQFIKFLVVERSAGQNLCNSLLRELKHQG